MEQGKQTDILVMDFSKAFDKVSHALLLQKLNHYGIRGKVNRWIQSFLSHRSQKVVLDGHKSESVAVESGVPQGSVLGPSLFLYYINDLPEGLRSKVRLFADDTIVYLTISDNSDCHRLQNDLNKLADWENTWKMRFHPDKCNVLTVTRKRSPIHHPYSLHGHALQHVESAKYLGCTLTRSLDWSEHINNIATKGNKIIGFLRRNLKINSKSTKELAYKALVRPTVEYASSVWDPHEKHLTDRLEMVQRRAARFVTGRYHNTSSVSSMMNDLGWPTLQQRRRDARVILFYKIHHQMIYFVPSSSLQPPTRCSLRSHSAVYQTLSARSNIRKYSYIPRTIRDWNHLPQETISSISVDTFKSSLSLVPIHQ